MVSLESAFSMRNRVLSVEAHHGCFSPPLSLPLFSLFSHVLVTIQGRLLSDVKLKFQKIPIAPTQGTGNSRGTRVSKRQETLEERVKGGQLN